MEKLKIIKGEYGVNLKKGFCAYSPNMMIQVRSENFISHVAEMIGGNMVENIHGAADIMVDSLNTYQECELLPSELLKQNKELREALEESKLQIEYLHGKFKATGSGNSVLSRIEQALKSKP